MIDHHSVISAAELEAEARCPLEVPKNAPPQSHIKVPLSLSSLSRPLGILLTFIRPAMKFRLSIVLAFGALLFTA
jgi:hypothetical protein